MICHAKLVTLTFMQPLLFLNILDRAAMLRSKMNYLLKNLSPRGNLFRHFTFRMHHIADNSVTFPFFLHAFRTREFWNLIVPSSHSVSARTSELIHLPFDFYATGSFFQFFFFRFLIDFFLFFCCRLPFFSSENDILFLILYLYFLYGSSIKQVIDLAVTWNNCYQFL